MAGVKELRRRIRSIKSTRQTTRAMEMVSASKLRRSQLALEAAAPYGAKLTEMLAYIVAAGSAPKDHELFQTREKINRRLVVLFAADRGLCGGYNNNLFKVADRYIATCREEGVEPVLFPIGRRANDYARKRWPGIKLANTVAEHQGKVGYDIPRLIAKTAIEEFTSGRVDEVVFIRNHYVSTLVYQQRTDKFLPIDPESLSSLSAEERSFLERTGYIFEPSAETVFNALLPKFVESKVFVAFASSITAEHSTRMVAMSSATKNCGELIDSLTLTMNRKRQAAITKEIIEVVSGAEALNG